MSVTPNNIVAYGSINMPEADSVPSAAQLISPSALPFTTSSRPVRST